MKYLLRSFQAIVLPLACFCTMHAHAQNAGSEKAPVPKRTQPKVTLKIGDAAPPLVAAKWVKGIPVTNFEPGKVYVVEFWATWCGPCRASMPHLSALARRYKNKVTVISFDVQELIAANDKNGDYVSKVQRFVNRLGDGMDYNVAADVREGTMWNTWMIAAGMYGIPASFVVGQDGKIAWIGHPMFLDDVVKMVSEGSFDDAARQKLAAQMKENREKVKTFNTQLADEEKAGDVVAAIKTAEEIMSLSPMSTGSMVKKKYELLQRTDPAAAHKFGEEVMKKHANDPLTVQDVAMFIAESREENGHKPDYQLALKMMLQAAARCDSEDPFTTSNLARAYFASGDIANAVKTQKKVLDLLNDESLVKQHQEVKDEAQKNFEQYNSPAQTN